MKTITFFNNKNAVGKTFIVYHLAWMLSELGHRVLAADLDPQSNLTSAFLEEDELERLWSDEGDPEATILGALQPLIDRMGDAGAVKVCEVTFSLSLVPGHLGLSCFEDRLSDAWRGCLEDNPPDAADAFRVTTAFHRVIARAAAEQEAELVLIDVGPSLGAINRAAMVASDHVVVPLGADLFSLQGLRNLGPTLRNWRAGWQSRRERGRIPDGLTVPGGAMDPLGYVLLNSSMRSNQPVKAYKRWADRIPAIYAEHVLGDKAAPAACEPDPHRLAMIRHYKSLMPMARDARKPMFLLRAADGAIGGHTAAVRDCYLQFKALAESLLRLCQMSARPAQAP